ncbi:MAG: DUF465 domain-containing protein [Pseudomonadota bacterium]
MDETVWQDEARLREHLEELRSEHRKLDEKIDAQSAAPSLDTMEVLRLKKRKLLLKDAIAHIEDRLLPDIIA